MEGPSRPGARPAAAATTTEPPALPHVAEPLAWAGRGAGTPSSGETRRTWAGDTTEGGNPPGRQRGVATCTHVAHTRLLGAAGAGPVRRRAVLRPAGAAGPQTPHGGGGRPRVVGLGAPPPRSGLRRGEKQPPPARKPEGTALSFGGEGARHAANRGQARPIPARHVRRYSATHGTGGKGTLPPGWRVASCP